MADEVFGVVIDPKRKRIMKVSYDSESCGESLSARGERFWHTVWKGIEGIPREDALPGKSEVSLEVPRDYVVDSENRSVTPSV